MPNSQSAIWTVALVVAILVALVNQIFLPAPWHRSINLLAVVVAIVSAYLSKSPLPGKPWDGVNRRKAVAH